MKLKFTKDEIWPVFIPDPDDGTVEIELTEQEFQTYEAAYVTFVIELNKLQNKVEE
jgi:hypothetical protein